MLTRADLPGDEGFTLVELVLTIALLGVIGGAVSSSLLVMLNTKQRAEQMLAVSSDRQFFANYFSDDAAGAQSVSGGTQPVCGSTLSTLVVFVGDDIEPATTTSVPTTTAWSYSPSARALVRTSCRNGGPAQTRTVARNVDATPTVSASCTASVAVSTTPKPAAVRITVPQTDGVPLDLCALRRPE